MEAPRSNRPRTAAAAGLVIAAISGAATGRGSVPASASEAAKATSAKDAGLNDSLREAGPDPKAVPGTTWSPVYPYDNGSTGDGEPRDRIDFVTYAGPS